MRELILTFHGLGDPPPDVSDSDGSKWLPVAWLEDILDVLPPRGVRITFDDGNRSDIEHALPALTTRGCRAQFFVLAGRLGAPNRLTETDVLQLHRAGMRIGSHGLHHRNWRQLPDAELKRELWESRTILSDLLHQEVDEAACPFGSYDRRVLRTARAAGYQRVYTSDEGVARDGWLAPRTSINIDRPLEYWLRLASTGPQLRPAPIRTLKRQVKQVR